MSSKGGPVFTFSLPVAWLPPCPLLVTHWLSDYCWVRLGSSTWNVLWFWNNNERRFRSLEKIIEESKLEVYRRIHDKPNEAEN